MLQVKIDKITATKNSTDKLLLSNLNFNIEKNTIYTIVGKNGTGKSTLIKAFTKLLDPRFYKIHGQVIFKNRNMLEITEHELSIIRKREIKYVFQDAVNSFDPLRNFKYYFSTFFGYPVDLTTELEYFLLPGTEKLFSLYPYEVSGGMAQRICFVLALLAAPNLIILDEPTSGIDFAIANLFLLRLKKFASQKDNSVLLVTQDLGFAEKVSSKIAYLSNGKLSDFYSPEQFFNNKTDDSLKNFLTAYHQLV